MRILITGASGFIGSHTARHLAGLGHEVVATGRDADRLGALGDTSCVLRTADLSADTLDSLVEGCEAIIHCAARAAPWGERALFWSDNVVATERLLGAARRSNTVRRFVFVSSPSIYFRRRDQLNLPEAFVPPRKWLTPYAETKWIAEERVSAVPELGPVVLRPRAVFGPGDAAIMPRIIAVARTGVFPLPGGGAAWTDITYIDNVVAAISNALQRQGIEGRAFNITNGEPIQVRDLLSRLLLALDLRARFIPMPRRLVLALAFCSERLAMLQKRRPEPRLTTYGAGLLGYSQTLSIEAARRQLGYQPSVSINEGLKRYAQWWKAQS
jgi:nucleoside-diphosphate-sugar epimerase